MNCEILTELYEKNLAHARGAKALDTEWSRVEAREYFGYARGLADLLGLPAPCHKCYGSGKQINHKLSKSGKPMRWEGTCHHCKGTKQEPIK